MDVLVAERDTVQVDDLARFDPDVFVVDPCGAAGASRPPFTVALAIRRNPRLVDIPLILLTETWTLELHAAEAERVRPDATLLIPFDLDVFVGTVRQAAASRRMREEAPLWEPGYDAPALMDAAP